MKVYNASYSETWGYGGFQEYEFIIIANTESEALGLALDSEAGGKAEHWNIEEINTKEPFAHQVSERSNA